MCNKVRGTYFVLSYGDALYLQGKRKLQELCVAGGPVTEEFGIIGVSLDGFRVMFHGYGVVSCGKERRSSSSY